MNKNVGPFHKLNCDLSNYWDFCTAYEGISLTFCSSLVIVGMSPSLNSPLAVSGSSSICVPRFSLCPVWIEFQSYNYTVGSEEILFLLPTSPWREPYLLLWLGHRAVGRNASLQPFSWQLQIREATWEHSATRNASWFISAGRLIVF